MQSESRGKLKRFLPYLWGIETMAGEHYTERDHRFYPTYEALKLASDQKRETP